MLPIVLEISDSALTGDKPPKHDAVWSILVKTEHPDGEDACLSRLASALAALAREHSLDVRGVITDLRRRDTHIANHLLLALYRGGAAHYGDEAITLLSDEPWRFQCGFADSPHWCAMEVIRAIVPHCTTDNRERIEAVILGYAPPYERTQDGYRLFGRAQLDLLSAFPAELRSPSANTRFHELVRKFGEPDNEPREITADFVEPPIEKTATDRMTDDQWLRAIDKYRSKHPTMYSADDALKGGARELAQTLAERVKEKPDRFARLSLRFPADANPVYLTHTLNALRTTAVASDLKLQVCRKAFAESPGPCGQSITDVLGSIEDPLPDKAVHMLHWLATEHEDPATETWQADAGGGQPYYNGDILTAGIEHHTRESGQRHSGSHPQRRRLHRPVPSDARPHDPGPERGCALMRRWDDPSHCLPRPGARHVAVPEHESVRGSPPRDTPCVRLYSRQLARRLRRIAADRRGHAPVV